MLTLDECAGRPEAGPKARRLAAARRLGLRVPDGLVLLPGNPLPALDELTVALGQLAHAERSAVPTLGQLAHAERSAVPGRHDPGTDESLVTEPLFAVRSSAAVEDLAGRSAAGLFSSSTFVARPEVLAAIETVRASGDSAAVRGYCGRPVAVAVLIQPMVPAARLGVLFLRPDGSAVCEERPVGTSEWSDVTPRLLSAAPATLGVAALSADAAAPATLGAIALSTDAATQATLGATALSTDAATQATLGATALSPDAAAEDARQAAAIDADLAHGARQLGALLTAEDPRTTAAFIEYAIASHGQVWFLQVRPAPPPPDPTPWTQPPEAEPLTYVFDRDHNPDPLSAAQTGIVDGVADLVPALRQRVLHSYLYYATVGSPSAPPAPLPLAELERRFTEEIAPTCETLLKPLEARLLDRDGALDERLPAAPSRVTLTLAEAWAAYRGVYARYVGELGPVLRRARRQLDLLLRKNLGQSLAQHGALLSGIGGAQTLRLQGLWELGRAGCPRPALRAHLARYGACAPCWDVAVPCDDEEPARVAATALALARGASSPLQLHAQAQAPYHEALHRLVAELPTLARDALLSLLPQVRAALRIAEDDDALFFRAQRLLRWALLGHGAALQAAGRLPTASAVFDLPWTLLQPDRAAAGREVGELAALAAQGAEQRTAARALVPPTRLCDGQPLWTLPDGVLLTGYGVPAPGVAAGPLRGRARVVRSLDEPLPRPAAGETDEALILVLPALLPSWAQELWQARALVTDSGGAFCHGAILARERGLPAVLGTQVATRSIRDGQELWVDASAGRVLVLP